MSEDLNYLAAPQVDDTAGQDFGMPQHYDSAMHESYPRPMETQAMPAHMEPRTGSGTKKKRKQ